MEDRIIMIIISIMQENEIERSLDQKISSSTLLIDDLGLDSFNLAQLTVEVEDEFGVDIFENGVITTVGEIFKQLK
jgi:acyl carrier protein